MIEIYDDLFAADFLLKLTEICLKIDWSYDNISGRYQFPSDSIFTKGTNNNRFFGRELYSRHDLNFVRNEASEEFFDVLDFFSKKTKKSFYLNEIKCNLQVMGQDSEPHQDKYTHKKNERSIIFYPQFEWQPEWGGQFEVFDAEGKILEEYSYKPGRIVFIDTSVLHRAKAPLVPNIPRISIVYRVEEMGQTFLNESFKYN